MHRPCWVTRGYPQTLEPVVSRSLVAHGFLTFGDLFPDGHVFSRTTDGRLASMTPLDHFVFLRLQVALRARCDTYPLPPDDFLPLSYIIGAESQTRLVSKLYRICLDLLPTHDTKVRAAWENDLGQSLTDHVWKSCCMQVRRVSFNHRHKLIQYKFLRRCYTTPIELARYDVTRSSACMKCGALDADFAHLTWTCPVISEYWTEVFGTMTTMLQVAVDPDPLVALMGYVGDIPRPLRRYTALAFLLAKREIALVWGSRRKPTKEAWLRSMAYCDDTSEIYIFMQPISSRPRDIWQPLRNYLATLDTPSSTQ